MDRCDRAESGIETMARYRLRAKGIRVRTQHEIPGIGRVDLLIGTRLILEVDGCRYHVDPDRFERDRERDRLAAELGYLVVRLSYQQVVYEWERAEESIMSVIRRREHLRALPKGRATGT